MWWVNLKEKCLKKEIQKKSLKKYDQIRCTHMVGESQGRLTQKCRRFHPVPHCLHCRDDDDNDDDNDEEDDDDVDDDDDDDDDDEDDAFWKKSLG